MPKSRVYILTEVQERRLRKMLGDDRLTCITCGEEFKIGDIIQSKPGGRNSNIAKLRHKECYDSLFI